MELAEGLCDLVECVLLGSRQLVCKHAYHSGWKDIATGEPKQVCYKCNKIVAIKGGMPKLDTPIISEEDVKNIDNDI